MDRTASAGRTGLGISLWLVFAAFLDNNAQQPLVSPYAVSLGATALVAALVVGAYSAANVVGNLLSAGGMDRLGRGRLMALAMGGAGMSLVVYGFAGNPSGLLAIRVAHGLAGGLLVPAVFAHLAAQAPEGGRGWIMARAGAVIGAAAVAGPPLAGLIRDRLGFGAAFAALGVVLLATAPLAWRHISHSIPGAPARRGGPGLGAAVRERALWPAYASAFALMFAMGTLGYRFPLHAQGLGYGSGIVGLFFSIFAAAAVLVMILPTGRASDLWGRIPLLVGGLGLVAVGVAGLEVFLAVPGLGAAMAVYGLGFGLVFPAMNALVADVAGGRRGPAFGVFHAFFSAGVISGPLVAALPLGMGPFARASLLSLTVAAVVAGSVRLRLSRHARDRAGKG